MLLWVPALHQMRSQALSVAAARLQLASAGRKRIFQSLLAMGLSNDGRLRSPFSVGSCFSLAHKLGGGLECPMLMLEVDMSKQLSTLAQGPFK